ncbi:MAG: SDR family oxidoreductase [Chloroflexi bacterium]|nr:SDR family oxidoreductase [Chloroflexota bacterium]
MRLAGRSALVTGGSRNLGRSIALALAREGADVAIIYHRAQEEAQQVAQAIASMGRKTAAVRADVGDYAQVQRAVPEAVAALGKLDLLVNNAGIAAGGRVADLDPEVMHRVFAVNFFGAFYVTKQALPYLRQHPRADVIFISTTSVRRERPGTVPYTASKTALNAMARCLAREEYGGTVRVNVVSPTNVEAGMGLRYFEREMGVKPDQLKQVYPKMPLGRIVQPEDVANLVVFLASKEAEMLSSQIIYVDGGDT